MSERKKRRRLPRISRSQGAHGSMISPTLSQDDELLIAMKSQQQFYDHENEPCSHSSHILSLFEFFESEEAWSRNSKSKRSNLRETRSSDDFWSFLKSQKIRRKVNSPRDVLAKWTWTCTAWWKSPTWSDLHELSWEIEKVLLEEQSWEEIDRQSCCRLEEARTFSHDISVWLWWPKSCRNLYQEWWTTEMIPYDQKLRREALHIEIENLRRSWWWHDDDDDTPFCV